MKNKTTDGFFDAKGVYRNPGEGFYDSQGIYRNPGEGFYDSQGVYRNPGEGFYDSRGVYVNPGTGFVDSAGIYRKVTNEKSDNNTSNSNVYSGYSGSYGRISSTGGYFDDFVMGAVSFFGHSFLSAIFIILGFMIWDYAFIDLVGKNYFLWVYLPSGTAFIIIAIIQYYRYKDLKKLGFKTSCLIFAAIYTFLFNLIGLFKFDIEMISYIIFVGLALSVIPSFLVVVGAKILDALSYKSWFISLKNLLRKKK